jgi:hypothetical protein
MSELETVNDEDFLPFQPLNEEEEFLLKTWSDDSREIRELLDGKALPEEYAYEWLESFDNSDDSFTIYFPDDMEQIVQALDEKLVPSLPLSLTYLHFFVHKLHDHNIWNVICVDLENRRGIFDPNGNHLPTALVYFIQSIFEENFDVELSLSFAQVPEKELEQRDSVIYMLTCIRVYSMNQNPLDFIGEEKMRIARRRIIYDYQYEIHNSIKSHDRKRPSSENDSILSTAKKSRPHEENDEEEADSAREDGNDEEEGDPEAMALDMERDGRSSESSQSPTMGFENVEEEDGNDEEEGDPEAMALDMERDGRSSESSQFPTMGSENDEEEADSAREDENDEEQGDPEAMALDMERDGRSSEPSQFPTMGSENVEGEIIGPESHESEPAHGTTRLQRAQGRPVEQDDEFTYSADVDLIAAVNHSCQVSVKTFCFEKFELFTEFSHLQNVGKTKIWLGSNPDGGYTIKTRAGKEKKKVKLEAYPNVNLCRMSDKHGATYLLTVFFIDDHPRSSIPAYMDVNYSLKTVAGLLNGVKNNFKCLPPFLAVEDAEQEYGPFLDEKERAEFEEAMQRSPIFDLKDKIVTNSMPVHLSKKQGEVFWSLFENLMKYLTQQYQDLDYPPFEETDAEMNFVRQLLDKSLYLVQSVGTKSNIPCEKSDVLDSSMEDNLDATSEELHRKVFDKIPFQERSLQNQHSNILIDLALNVNPVKNNSAFLFNGNEMTKHMKELQKMKLGAEQEGVDDDDDDDDDEYEEDEEDEEDGEDEEVAEDEEYYEGHNDVENSLGSQRSPDDMEANHTRLSPRSLRHIQRQTRRGGDESPASNTRSRRTASRQIEQHSSTADEEEGEGREDEDEGSADGEEGEGREDEDEGSGVEDIYEDEDEEANDNNDGEEGEGREDNNQIEDGAGAEASSSSSENSGMAYLYSLFATRKAFANGEFVRNEFLPSYSSSGEKIISVTNKFPNHVVSAAVSYFPTAKIITLAQTRKNLHMAAKALPEDIKSILFTVDGLPTIKESCKQATRSIIELANIFKNMDTKLNVHHKHSARAECTFWLEGPPAEEEGMSEQLLQRVSLALNRSILNRITVVETTALRKQTMEVYELYMKPLSRFVENLRDVEADRRRETSFFDTYSRGHIPAALVECAEIVLRYLQIGHPASSSILYGYLKNPEGDYLLQAPLSMRKAITSAQNHVTGLMYGLDQQVIPLQHIEEEGGEVKGVGHHERARYKKVVRDPDLYVWALRELHLSLAKLAKNHTMVTDHEGIALHDDLQKGDVEDFMESLAVTLYSLHNAEMFRTIKKRILKGSISLREGWEMPRMPRCVEDLHLLQWANATVNADRRKIVGFKKTATRIPSVVCALMFGKPILKVTDKGWLKSTARFFFSKVSTILTAMASAFSRRVDARLSREFRNINPFDEKMAFQEVIATHAARRGFVWHTHASNQNKYPGPIVSVLLIRNNLPSAVSTPNGQQTEGRAARYNPPKNNFDECFLTSTTNNQIQTMKVFELRACVQALINYLELKKHFPKEKTEIMALNQNSVALFDTFMQIKGFRSCNQHWHNLRKRHDARKLFIKANSVQDAEQTSPLWCKVFQTADEHTRQNIDHLLAAINEDGDLQIEQYSLDTSSFAWPRINMGEDENEDDPPQLDNEDWTREVEYLLESTLWKPSVKERVRTIHSLWHQKLKAMRFVGEGEEDNFTADLWNQLHAFTNNHKDWQDQNTLKAYFFKNKIS